MAKYASDSASANEKLVFYSQAACVAGLSRQEIGDDVFNPDIII